MHRPILIPASLLLLAALGGCSGGSDEAPTESAPADAGLLEPQRQALERARGVEDDLAEAAGRQRDAIDEGGG